MNAGLPLRFADTTEMQHTIKNNDRVWKNKNAVSPFAIKAGGLFYV